MPELRECGKVINNSSNQNLSQIQSVMPDNSTDKHWKLKLRYRKLETPFTHFTLIAEGEVGDLSDGFVCEPGKAFMGIKTWATSSEQAVEIISYVSEQIGFVITGEISIYETAPEEPPREQPYGYGINFTPFK